MAATGASTHMRRIVTLGLLVLLPGCTGFGTFLDHTFTLPGTNPNRPMADSENVRRSLGRDVDVTPLTPEPGNVWPGPPPPQPTLTDVQQQQSGTDQDTTVPGAQPGLPAGRQPRPARRGSSTPPGSVEPGLPPAPGASVLPPAPSSPAPGGPGRTGQTVITPQGPAVDTGGTSGYRSLTTPQGPGAIMVPNGNGTSTIINPNGTIQTVPTPR